MILTPDNYFSPEADREFMSVSQYKSFMKCEAAAYAELMGEWQREEKEAFLVGHYVHAWAEGKLDEFIAEHPEIIASKGATKGELKAPFKVAQAMTETLATDAKVMFYLRGCKETPVTAELFGVPWKGRFDVINTDLNYIVDLKTAASITEFKYDPRFGKRVSFIEQWDYLLQAAVYTELERLATGGERKDYYVVAVTKEDPPDHAIIDLTDATRIEVELEQIRQNLPRIIAVKSGMEQPERCEHCAYCRATKRVGKPVHYTELREAI